MHFTKMNGAGNDFLIIDAIDAELPLPAGELAAALCHRRFAVGADGLMIVREAQHGGDYAMEFFNSDGTRGEMCGNGARCIARYGYEKGLAGTVQHIETTAGRVTGERLDAQHYRVRLNPPTVLELHRPACGYDCAYLELGSPGLPHGVCFLEDWETWPEEKLRALGRALRFSPAFPKGANITFAARKDENTVRAVTFERGVEDFTLACGTGAGCTVAALTLLGQVRGQDTQVHMPGGTLSVTVERTEDALSLLLTGPTVIVCEGDICAEALRHT